HHAPERRGGSVAARGARTAGQGNASHRHVDLGRREPSAMASAPMTAFRQRLQQLGWAVGQNLQIDYSWASDLHRIRAFSAELVSLAPDVLFTMNTPSVLAMHDKTNAIPIVFAIVTDPVGSGLVSNLAHPGINVTGFTNYEFSTSVKWLELLKEMAPGIAK